MNACWALLARDALRAGLPRPSWSSEAEATVRFEHRERTYWIRPDGAGVLTHGPAGAAGGAAAPFLLEYDRGTMRRRDYLRKLAGIAAYFDREVCRATHESPPCVLVIAEDERGEARFAASVKEATARFGVALPVLLTTRRRVQQASRGTLDWVWRTPADEQRRPWLPAQDRPVRQ